MRSWKRVNWNGGKGKAGMKTMAACLEWLALLGRKVKQMAACLKRLAWKVKKYCNEKNRVFEQILR